MLVVVCLRAALRTDIPLRLDGQAAGIDAASALSNAPLGAARSGMAALGTALDLKAAGVAQRVLALAAGPPSAESLLREALAHGADEVLRVWPQEGAAAAGAAAPQALDGSAATTRLMAQAVAHAIAERKPALLLAGDSSGDTEHECFGAFLAASLGAAFAHRAVVVEAARGAPDKFRVMVKIERGYTQEMELPRPAVVTMSGRAGEAAYPSLPAWLAALAAPVPRVDCPPFPPPPCTTRLRPPLPRVKRYTVPDETLDAEGRIRAMVSLPAGGGGELLGPEIPPAQQAAAAAAFLREHGYL